MIKDIQFLNEIQCPVCKKMFIEANQNIYKVTINKEVWHCCSWTCYNQALDIRNKDKTRKEYQTIK